MFLTDNILIDGVEVSLNEAEKKHRQNIAENALGVEVDLTNLYAIERTVSTQRFFDEVNPAPSEFIPIDAGTGADQTKILGYRSYITGDESVNGISPMGMMGAAAHKTKATVGLDSYTVDMFRWREMAEYDISQLSMSAKTGVWNFATELERGRKKRHDLMMAKIAMIGDSNSRYTGLLGQAGITLDTTTIVGSLATLSFTQLKALAANLVSAYYQNSNDTALPDTFVIPMSEKLGMFSSASDTYVWDRSKYSVLLEVLKEATGNPNAKIIGSVFADAANSPNGKAYYALYRQDYDTLRMYAPRPYQVYNGNTVDGVTFQSTAESQFSNVFINRPSEVLYLTHN